MSSSIVVVVYSILLIPFIPWHREHDVMKTWEYAILLLLLLLLQLLLLLCYNSVV